MVWQRKYILPQDIDLKSESNTEDFADFSLMAAVGRGDEQAFKQLIERHQLPVIRTIRKMIGPHHDAEDLAQDVFVRIWNNASKYRPDAKFTTYLFAIVRNVVFSYTRSRSKRIEGKNSKIIELAENDASCDHNKNPDNATELRELQQAIDVAIGVLPDDQRLCVVLRRYENMPYEEIAKILNTSVSSVKSHLFRARTSLRDSLSSFLGD